jgi:hypothetical protein
MAATRADRTDGNVTVLQGGVYTACEACADDPRKPPKWQVKAARIIHHQGEQTIYFEDARLEFFGVPLAYLPFFSTPDPSAKRKTGVLVPTITTSSRYGVAVSVPYYWALAPNYDFTLTPKVTTRQGPLVQGEWRHRLLNGSYTIRASGIFQLDKDAFAGTPGYREWRGDINTTGQFASPTAGPGVGTARLFPTSPITGLRLLSAAADLLRSTPDHVMSSPTCRDAAREASSICARSTSTASRASTTRGTVRSSIRSSTTNTCSAARYWAASCPPAAT